MHINQLALAKSSIKRRTHFICLRTCHTADFGQVWPYPWSAIGQSFHAVDNGQMWQKNIMPPVGGLCLTADFDQMWSKLCPSSEDFVMQRTLTKCGQKWCPSLENFVTQQTLTMWPKLCPSLEDFVMQRTLTKCCPNCAPCWRTLSCSGLWPNVVQILPLVGQLCLTADFNQMWSKHMPLVGGLCHTADFDQMWSKHVLLDRGLCFAIEFDHICINNILIIKNGWHQTNGF